MDETYLARDSNVYSLKGVPKWVRKELNFLNAIISSNRHLIEILKRDSRKLYRLEVYGVDNWSGYESAMNDEKGYFSNDS